jgi:type IV pilus assembly protein PilW
MVAMTLSLILLAGVLSVLYSSKITYNENERVARVQESMRAGMEMILRDLRGGGYPGCTRPLSPSGFLSTLSAPSSLLWNFSRPIEGFEASSGSWSPTLPSPLDALTITPGNDILVIHTVRSNARVYPLAVSMASGVSNVEVQRNTGEVLRAGIPMVISDCEKATVFSVASINNNTATTTRLRHPIGGGGPGNGSADLQAIFRANSAANASVAPLDTLVYFIAPSTLTDSSGASRGPSLWRIIATEPAGSAGTPQEVMEGVEALQVLYGVDLNTDLVVDEYRAANQVTNWSNVIAVSLAMVVRSAEETNPQVSSAQTFDLLGTTFTAAADRRRRAMFTTTIALRNQAT